VNDDGHAFSLVDEPFEQVPQGGPDLSADQARAHEDLPFVWWDEDPSLIDALDLPPGGSKVRAGAGSTWTDQL
jgi:hypothetical protein